MLERDAASRAGDVASPAYRHNSGPMESRASTGETMKKGNRE
jgi:hypothetical protein